MVPNRTLSCVSSPYDLRPPLDLLEGWAKHLLEVDDRPLYILFGEDHHRTFDIVLRQAFIERLHSSGHQIAYGSENDSNMLEWLIENWYGIEIPDEVRGKICQSDRDGKKFLQSAHAAYIPTTSPHSRRNLWAALLNSSVSFQCNDIPRTEDDISIDQSSDPVAQIVYDLLGVSSDEAGVIDLASNNGMLIRNRYIAERAITHQRGTGARIYIQDCGKHHLYGYHKDKLGYKGSLSQIFADSGLKTLVIANLTKSFKIANLPRDGAKSAFRRNGISFNDTASESFHGVYEQEIHTLKRLHRASGREFSLYDASLPDEDDMSFKIVESEIPEWIRDAVGQPPSLK